MTPIREAVELVLAGYQPHPALGVDRAWDLVAANQSAALLTAGVAAELLQPPANVLRLSLHPDGMAPRIRNLPQWRFHVLHRLAREAQLTADPALTALHAELAALPGGTNPAPPNAIAVPLRIRHGDAELTFLSTVTVFGTAVDITASELSIEAFLPADPATSRAMQGSTPLTDASAQARAAAATRVLADDVSYVDPLLAVTGRQALAERSGPCTVSSPGAHSGLPGRSTATTARFGSVGSSGPGMRRTRRSPDSTSPSWTLPGASVPCTGSSTGSRHNRRDTGHDDGGTRASADAYDANVQHPRAVPAARSIWTNARRSRCARTCGPQLSR